MDRIARGLSASVLCVGLLLAGCSSAEKTVEGESVPAAEGTATAAEAEAAGESCGSSDAPLLTLDPQGSGEPTLAIPQPAGWQRNTDLDSAVIRGVILTPALRANDFTPNAVVTLADLSASADTAQEAIEVERRDLERNGMAIESTEPGTVCGLPSTTFTYTLQERPVTALIVGAESGDSVYSVAVTLQTTEPDNPTYVRDSTAILDGFQVHVPR